MTFAWIPPGTFLMGSPPEEPERRDDERQHKVTLTKGFYLGIHPVTQAQWQAIMGNNSSAFKGEDLPVETVSWQDCQAFCEKLGQQWHYRLPTEAEWEYACRAGTTTPSPLGEIITTDQANYDGNHPHHKGEVGWYRRQTTPIGSFPPNVWGLFDMPGNVCEWCADWYNKDYYKRSPQEDPQGPKHGQDRVLRGGSWFNYGLCCRAACRVKNAPAARYSFNGFRVLLQIPR